MKRLKTLLQHSILYYVVLFISLLLYVFNSAVIPKSIYNEFKNEEFIITNITDKDYGLKLDLKGKEKVIGYLYYKENEKNDFLKIYSPGDKVLLTGDIKDITKNTVPDTFNYEKYLISNKIYNVIEITDISLISKSENIFYKLKNYLTNRSKRLEKSYPYINSLVFGNNSYLDEDVLSSYRENGISHLFAISGLHISIFIYLFSVFLDKLKVKFSIKSLVLILFLCFYMFLTNFSMSVLRGAIFASLLILNKTFKLGISSTNLLILTLSLILFSNPLNLNNVGLEYSFLVTLFLIMFSKLVDGKGKIYSLFMISLIAFLVSYPITINNFNQVNFLSIGYNLFFVPYVSSILLPVTLLSFVFPFLDSVLYFLITIIETLSQFLNSIDIFKISMCKMSVLMIVSYFVLICQLFRKWNSRKFKYIGILLIFLIIHYFMPFKTSDYVMFIDVGQGDSAIINVNGKVTLIDTGGLVMYDDTEYTYKIVKNKLLPYLKANGIRQIDNLIISHGDADHMKEAYYLVDNFKVDTVIFNVGEYNELEQELVKLLDKKNVKYQRPTEYLNIGKYKLQFLNTRIYDNENDNSSVIYFNYNNIKMLFMGDAGTDKEDDILDKYDISDIDILKVGHHGSDTSSGVNFIDKIKPKYSVISVGKNNRYGHPKDETLEVLANSKIYRTDLNGSIMFKLKDSKYDIVTYSP